VEGRGATVHVVEVGVGGCRWVCMGLIDIRLIELVAAVAVNRQRYSVNS